jgi:hypothetical protein
MTSTTRPILLEHRKTHVVGTSLADAILEATVEGCINRDNFTEDLRYVSGLQSSLEHSVRLMFLAVAAMNRSQRMSLVLSVVHMVPVSQSLVLQQRSFQQCQTKPRTKK